ncbi:MAG: patatin-like phospholipase family protein [bacterium]|nr:patatin-like phospholipase family protein [bacterium]
MKTILIITCAILTWAGPLSAMEKSATIGGLSLTQPCSPLETADIGLAISGGGARGLATIGILKAFEEHGINIRAITGTSMGGIMGGLYACGYSADDLRDFVDRLQFDSLFNNAPARGTMFLTQRASRDQHLISVRFDGWRPVIPTGLTKGQKLTSLLTELTTAANYRANQNFRDLPISFRTVTTDIENGEAVTLDSGSLANAMRATTAFPLAFTPVKSNGRQLMDGGILVPIPVQLLTEILPDSVLIVAVNTASSLVPREELNSPIDIANQVTTIMTADKMEAQLKLADFVITPELKKYESTDFDKKEEIIKIGYEIGLKMADSILAFAALEKETEKKYLIGKITGNQFSTATESELKLRLPNRTVSWSELIKILSEISCQKELFELQVKLSAPDSGNTYQVNLNAIPALDRTKYAVQFEGNRIISDSALNAQFSLAPKKLSSAEFHRSLDRLLNLYAVENIDLANITSVQIDHDHQTVIIRIDEGILYRIDVNDNVRTSDWFVRSYFPLKVGSSYSTESASRGLDNIYGTDLFNSVTLNVERDRRGTIAKIGIAEKQYRQVRLGWHWHETYESEQFVQLLDDNVMGMGLEFLIHAQYADDRQRYYSSFQADRIWSTYLTARAELFHDRLNRSLYDSEGIETYFRKERRTGGMLSIGQQIARLGTFTSALVAERVKYHIPETASEQTVNLRYLDLRSLVESFDRIPFTVSGNRTELQLQLAGDFFGGDMQYTRFSALLEQYLPLGKYLNLHPRLELGLSGSGLPPSERFFLGGSRSFFGFQTSQLEGDKLFHFSYAIRLAMPMGLYLSARHDIGEVYAHTDQIKLRNLRHGFGLKLLLNTPMGPFSISHGIGDSDHEETYINVGFEF